MPPLPLPRQQHVPHAMQSAQPHLEHEVRMRKLFAHRQASPPTHIPTGDQHDAYDTNAEQMVNQQMVDTYAPPIEEYVPPTRQRLPNPQMPQQQHYVPPGMEVQGEMSQEAYILAHHYEGLMQLVIGLVPDSPLKDSSLAALNASKQYALACRI